MNNFKLCPFCGEEIKSIAIKCKHCSSMLQEKHENFISKNTIINTFSSNFEIIDEVGRGGMAIVYKAIQKSLDRIVALKVIPKEFTHDKEFVSRFKNEARDSGKLNHPNIITVYDSGEIGGYPYMVMEYLEGGTISDLIRKKRYLAQEEIKKIIIPILDGLGNAHKQGIIHRDIKSSNIMFDKMGRPVLMDFGIAKSIEGTKFTQAGTYMGTPAYSSPEQADTDREVNHQTDIYSLGIVLYEMTTGSVPFKGENPINVLYDVIHKTPTPPNEINNGLELDFSNAIMHSLEKDLTIRYHNCESFSNALINGEKRIPTSLAKKEIDKTKEENEFLKNNNSGFTKKRKGIIAIIAVISTIIITATIVFFVNINQNDAEQLVSEKKETITLEQSGNKKDIEKSIEVVEESNGNFTNQSEIRTKTAKVNETSEEVNDEVRVADTEEKVNHPIVENMASIDTLFYIYAPRSIDFSLKNSNNIYYKIVLKNFKTFDFKIYDRWGDLLYQSMDYEEHAWDGRKANSFEKVSSGTYFYILITKDRFGSEKKYSGSFVLIE
jgi:gliding motility-associated-like protein